MLLSDREDLLAGFDVLGHGVFITTLISRRGDLMVLVVIIFVDVLLHILLRRMTGIHNIHHIVNGGQALELILDHFLEFLSFAQYLLEEGVDILDVRSVHFIAFFRGIRPKGDLVPRKVIPRKGYCPFKFINGHWGCELVIDWDVIQLRRRRDLGKFSLEVAYI